MKRGLVALAVGALVLGNTGASSKQAKQQARAELGRRLFYDADLSRDGTMACATCHEQHHGFADGNPAHPGVTDEPGRRNVPGLANVRQFKRLTWADPRQTSLEHQAAVPVFGTHPVEMGMGGMEAEIPKRLGRDPCYVSMFAAAFPQKNRAITFAKISSALASFERTLVSRSSPYDHGQLSTDAKAGQALFRRHCASCHSGADFTDQAYHRLGPIDPMAKDDGLMEVTKRPADRQRFRTPSLRNLTVTAPYWHDGSAPTLFAAIARHRLYVPLDALPKLEVFLNSLTDTNFIANPDFSLPKSACGKAL